jgi:hypothetical protein
MAARPEPSQVLHRALFIVGRDWIAACILFSLLHCKDSPKQRGEGCDGGVTGRLKQKSKLLQMISPPHGAVAPDNRFAIIRERGGRVEAIEGAARNQLPVRQVATLVLALNFCAGG